MGMQRAVMDCLAEINVAAWFEGHNTLTVLSSDLDFMDEADFYDKANEPLIGVHWVRKEDDRFGFTTPFETQFVLTKC